LQQTALTWWLAGPLERELKLLSIKLDAFEKEWLSAELAELLSKNDYAGTTSTIGCLIWGR
jgi:hypothetical protein